MSLSIVDCRLKVEIRRTQRECPLQHLLLDVLECDVLEWISWFVYVSYYVMDVGRAFGRDQVPESAKPI